MKEYAVWINSKERDFEFNDDGEMIVVEDLESYAQGVEVLLRTLKGEFDLLKRHGTEYNLILGKHLNFAEKEATEAIMRDGIFQEISIKEILDIKITIKERVVYINFKILTHDDEIIERSILNE